MLAYSMPADVEAELIVLAHLVELSLPSCPPLRGLAEGLSIEGTSL